MNRLTAIVVALFLPLSSPLAAQTLTVLLPSITFPGGTVTPSTKGCEVTQASAPVCQLAE
jgi:hypothetical protein